MLDQVLECKSFYRRVNVAEKDRFACSACFLAHQCSRTCSSSDLEQRFSETSLRTVRSGSPQSPVRSCNVDEQVHGAELLKTRQWRIAGAQERTQRSSGVGRPSLTKTVDDDSAVAIASVSFMESMQCVT